MQYPQPVAKEKGWRLVLLKSLTVGSLILQEDPGPGRYTLRRERSHSAPPTPRGCGFRSSTARQTQAHLRNKVHNPPSLPPSILPPSPPPSPQCQVGPGQYDINRWQRHQHSNGNHSVFISLTPRLPQRVDSPRELLLNERLHPKGHTYPTAAESLG